ncbi:unnamed protein product [Rotaria sp. Silwood1]|nr:unnamed protein product [Rotaria sp. Silwood1]
MEFLAFLFYTGLWYEIFPKENQFQEGGKCVNATYTINLDGIVSVLNQAISALGVYENIEGYAVVKNPAVSATLEVTFGSNQIGSYDIISTHYKEYSIVYSCTDIPNTNLKIEFACILDRRKILPLATINKCNEFLANLGVSAFNLSTTLRNC